MSHAEIEAKAQGGNCDVAITFVDVPGALTDHGHLAVGRIERAQFHSCLGSGTFFQFIRSEYSETLFTLARGSAGPVRERSRPQHPLPALPRPMKPFRFTLLLTTATPFQNWAVLFRNHAMLCAMCCKS